MLRQCCRSFAVTIRKLCCAVSAVDKCCVEAGLSSDVAETGVMELGFWSSLVIDVDNFIQLDLTCEDVDSYLMDQALNCF